MTTTEMIDNFSKQLEQAIVSVHQLQGAIAAIQEFEKQQTEEEPADGE